MIRLACTIPPEVTLAVSGGPDSMALLDFCLHGKRNVRVINFDHGTDFSVQARMMVARYCAERGVPFNQYTVGRPLVGSGYSLEEYWSVERRKVYDMVEGTVATGHNLDDAVEWWLLTSFRGQGRLMPTSNGNLIRPFLLTPKAVLVEWCDRKGIPYLEDKTNLDGSNDRGKVRQMMPLIEGINPGIRTTVRNLYSKNGGVAQ